MPKRRGVAKVVDDEIVLKKPRKGAVLKEEVWQAPDGEVVKYSIAYINRRICGKDNGRVLGYDNSHDYYHRHFMGAIEPIEFESYQALSTRFHEEVIELWRREDEQD